MSSVIVATVVRDHSTDSWQLVLGGDTEALTISFPPCCRSFVCPQKGALQNNTALCGRSGLRKPVAPAGPVEVHEVWPAIRGVDRGIDCY